MKRIYISGKITGLHPQVASEFFNMAAQSLKVQGYLVMNPMSMFPAETSREIIELIIQDCDAVYMLENWRDSKGAKDDHALAIRSGKEIIYQQAMTSLQYKTLMAHSGVRAGASC